jgi:hypothetical protein
MTFDRILIRKATSKETRSPAAKRLAYASFPARDGFDMAYGQFDDDGNRFEAFYYVTESTWKGRNRT